MMQKHNFFLFWWTILYTLTEQKNFLESRYKVQWMKRYKNNTRVNYKNK